MKLTGKKRYRSARNWVGKQYLVLQVEVEGLVAENVGNVYIDCERCTWWRDATVEDLTEDNTVVS